VPAAVVCSVGAARSAGTRLPRQRTLVDNNLSVNILVATDFSAAADTATRTAALLAGKLGGTIDLVRAVEPPAMLYPEMAGAEIEGLEAALGRGVAARLAQVAAGLRQQGIAVETTMLHGFPEQVIPAHARQRRSSLIVMGAHGRRPVTRLLLGSVTERTMLDAPCPVLVVREGEVPFADWAAGRRPLRVMVGVHPSPTTEAALAWLRRLRRVAACDVSLVHHYWPPREYARLGLSGPREMFDTDPEVAALLERDLGRRLGELPGEGTVAVRARAAWGRLGEALADQAEADQADLLIVGTQQPHGWKRGSVAVVALRAGKTPLLAVPAATGPGDEPPVAARVPQLHTVLAATDLSEAGNACVAHACALLRGAGGVLELCHAHESPDSELGAAARVDLETRLQALVPPEAPGLHIEAHVTVLTGCPPAQAILQTARRLGADAICIAARGRTRAHGRALGSVAEAVVAGADVPVHLVRGP
jgi:nucleotide-binding universal stress UspA family protein